MCVLPPAFLKRIWTGLPIYVNIKEWKESPEGREIIKPVVRFSTQKHVPATLAKDSGVEGPWVHLLGAYQNHN